jgi:hypothetical protein
VLVRVAVALLVAVAGVVVLTTRHTDEHRDSSCVRLAIPAYVPPADFVAAAAGGEAGVLVLNPGDGPDIERDDALAVAVEQVQAEGVVVLGYVLTGYGAADVDTVVAQASRYARWYAVDGIFLDEVASERADLAHYERMASALRAAGFGTIAMNPGLYPDPGYAGAADLLVTFEGTADDYRALDRPPGFEPVAGEWHLVHTADADDARQAVALAKERNVTRLFVTDRTLTGDTWNALPPYFDAERAAAAATC